MCQRSNSQVTHHWYELMLELAATASKEEAEAAARAQPQVMHFLEGMSVRKVIVVPGKIVNIVAG